MTQILAMLIDVHAHFYHAATPRADWRERNASRLAAGRKIGVTIHVASILGTWGRTSPIYFPSPRDVEDGNTALLALEREHPDLIRGYVTVNPNYTSQARAEITRCLGAGMVGIKLAASRRATWSSCNGGTRRASSRVARSPATDADRRQRLPRRLPVPARAWYVARRVAARDGARRNRRSVGEPSAEPVLAPADGGERLAVRHRGARAAAQTGARAASGPRGLGWRAGRGGGPRRSGGAVRSAVLRARPDGSRDARPRCCLRGGEASADDGGPARGRAPASPQRPRRGAAGGGGARPGSC